jgi:predicted nucleotidyltransferase
MNTKDQPDLGALFFGTYRRQVLSLLLLHPDETYHLREIGRITGMQPGTLRRELEQLAAAGVVQREKVGNLVRYQADPQCPIYEELRGILKKTAGMADILRDALSPLSGQIAVAFVYGSVARGTERRASDIDLMIVGTVSFEDVVQALHSCQEQARREINPKLYDPVDFEKKIRKQDGFLRRVLDGPRLFILGKDDDLGKLGWKDSRKIPVHA